MQSINGPHYVLVLIHSWLREYETCNQIETLKENWQLNFQGGAKFWQEVTTPPPPK